MSDQISDKQIQEVLDKDNALTDEINDLSTQRRELRESDVYVEVKKIQKNAVRQENYQAGRLFRQLKSQYNVKNMDELAAKLQKQGK